MVRAVVSRPPGPATAALPAPDRWRVTWRPPLSRMAGPGGPRRTSPRPSARYLETSGRPNGGVGRPCPNQRNKSERKENVRQPQLCSMPGRSPPTSGASGFHASSDPPWPRHWALHASAVVLTGNERVPCGDAPNGGRPHHAAAANGADGAQGLEHLPGDDDL